VIPRAPATGVNRHRCPEVVPKLLQLLDQFSVGPRLPVAPAVVGVQPAFLTSAPKLEAIEILGQPHITTSRCQRSARCPPDSHLAVGLSRWTAAARGHSAGSTPAPYAP